MGCIEPGQSPCRTVWAQYFMPSRWKSVTLRRRRRPGIAQRHRRLRKRAMGSRLSHQPGSSAQKRPLRVAKEREGPRPCRKRKSAVFRRSLGIRSRNQGMDGKCWTPFRLWRSVNRKKIPVIRYFHLLDKIGQKRNSRHRVRSILFGIVLVSPCCATSQADGALYRRKNGAIGSFHAIRGK